MRDSDLQARRIKCDMQNDKRRTAVEGEGGGGERERERVQMASRRDRRVTRVRGNRGMRGSLVHT